MPTNRHPTSKAGSTQAISRWLLRQPAAWATVIFGVASMLTLTAPGSANPPVRVGVGLMIGGAVLGLASLLERHVLGTLLGVSSVVAGAFLQDQQFRHVQTVSRGIAVVALVLGVRSARGLRRRGFSLGIALTTALTIVGAGALFIYYERELLALGLGLTGLGASAGVGAGVTLAGGSTPRPDRVGVAGAVHRTIDEVLARLDRPSTADEVESRLYLSEQAGAVGRFFTLMCFASAIASLGILTDSTATVIGAMLVAPLMTPLMAVSLALVARWPGRLLSSAALVAAGIAVPIASGMIAAAVVGRGVDPVINSQITSRVDPTLLDLAVALAAGAAGAYAISRRDVADSLPGAAVAIALVPPLAVVGITLQLAAWDDALGALLLFVTNGLAIVAMGAVTFVVTGVASPGGDGDSAVGHWVAGFAATGLLVLWGLVESTASQNTQGAQTAIARETVERWSDDFELDQLEIANDSLMLALTGPTEPDVGQLEDLVAQLEGVVEVDSIDVRFTLESQWLLEFDE